VQGLDIVLMTIWYSAHRCIFEIAVVKSYFLINGKCLKKNDWVRICLESSESAHHDKTLRATAEDARTREQP